MTLDQYRPIPPAAQHTRRTLLRRIGASTAVLGVLSVAGCTPTSSDTAATNSTSSALPGPTPNLPAGDMSRGADNFYTSDQVSVQKVTFKNQYEMNVTGNLFVPNDLDRNTKNAAIVVGHPMGAVKEQSANLYATKMAERGFVTMSLDLSFWGESEGQPRNAGGPRHLRRRLQRRRRLPAHPVVRRPRTHRRARDLRQRKLRHQRRQDRPPDQGRGHGQHVRHGCAPTATDCAGAITLEQRQAVLAARRAAARRRIRRRRSRVHRRHARRTRPTSQRAIDREFYDFYRTARGNSPDTTTQPTLSSNVQVHELLPVRRHRDDLPAPHAVHHRRSGPLPRVQRTGLPARRRTQSNWSSFPAPATSTSTTAPTSSPSTSSPAFTKAAYKRANTRQKRRCSPCPRSADPRSAERGFDVGKPTDTQFAIATRARVSQGNEAGRYSERRWTTPARSPR